MVESLVFLILHLLLYGLSPILIVSIFRAFKSTAFFYFYFGFLYVFTQLFAVLYSIKLSEDLLITGGNIAYSSIILITFFLGIASQEPTVVRNLISIQVFFNFFLFFFYQLLVAVLSSPTTVNLFSVSPGIFNTTITINIVSSVVFVIEILALFYILEKIKEKFKRLSLVIALYIVSYIGILCLDGFLFPFIVSFFEPVFGQFIVGNIAGKLILGLGFSPFLLAFMVLHKRSLTQFIKKPFSTRLVILPKRKQLIEKLQMTEENLRKTEKQYENAYNRATFYKDLFTHDISNIIHVISMSFQLFNIKKKTQAKLDSEMLESLFQTIDDQLNRGKSLISCIQKLSELDKEKIDLDRTDLLDYLLKAVKYAKESNLRKLIKINVERSKDQIFVIANELLADVFENILFNAIKYNNNEVPEINIIVSKAKLNGLSYVKLEFKDNGIGVHDSKKEKIFLEGFKELKGEKGMGIGLSLITKIIKLYNGKIWVEDRIEGEYLEGSNFIVLIPEFKESTEK